MSFAGFCLALRFQQQSGKIYLQKRQPAESVVGVNNAAVATRFDKLARKFLAAVLLASTRLWLSAYKSAT